MLKNKKGSKKIRKVWDLNPQPQVQWNLLNKNTVYNAIFLKRAGWGGVKLHTWRNFGTPPFRCKKPIFTKLYWNQIFALKVWEICRKCEKAENPSSGFELVWFLHIWQSRNALDHWAILLDTFLRSTLWDFNVYQSSCSKYHSTNYTGYLAWKSPLC